MIVRIIITDSATYDFDSSECDPETALMLAKQWFSEREPQITVGKYAACELTGSCPYGSNHSCSECD